MPAVPGGASRGERRQQFSQQIAEGCQILEGSFLANIRRKVNEYFLVKSQRKFPNFIKVCEMIRVQLDVFEISKHYLASVT